MKKNLFLLSGLVFASLVSCNSDVTDLQDENKITKPTQSKQYEYNYTDTELLKISSILFDKNLSKTAKSKSPIINSDTKFNNDLELSHLELNYFGLGQEKDSLIVSVSNKQTNSTVILSKDKRLPPVIGFVKNLDDKSTPPAMKYYLSETASVLQDEVDDFVTMKGELKIEELNREINSYFSDISKEKLANIEKLKNTSKRLRESEELAEIIGKADIVYVKEPLLKTNWYQRNAYISNHPVYTNENEYDAEGCVTTAIGQVLNYWGNHVKKITFGNPYGGQYFNNFTRTSIDYPYASNSTSKESYHEVQYNISQQITVSKGPEGRGSYVINQAFGTKDLRDFINDHVTGMKVVDYTGTGNLINSDEYYVIESISENRPAIVSGDRHAWVCDGLVKVRVRRGFWPIYWTEHKYYIHMNWGWGSVNGWFFNNGSDSYKPNGSSKNYRIFKMLSIAPN